MNNEHNIEDILKLLKESVDRDSKQEVDEKKGDTKPADLTEKRLKQQLKKQYGSDGTVGNIGMESTEYMLDQELLQEFATAEESEWEEEILSESKETVFADTTQIISESDPEETDFAEATDEEELFVEESNEIETAEDAPYDRAPWEETEAEIEAEIEEIMDDEADLLASEETDGSDEEALDWNSLLETEPDCGLSVQEPLIPLDAEGTAESGLNNGDKEDYDVFPKIETIALTDLVQDFSSAEEKEEDALSVPNASELGQMSESKGATAEFCVNESIFDLMLQFGCQEELDEISEEDVTEEFAEENSFEDEGEYRSAAQNGKILTEYRQSSIRALIRLIAIGALAILVFLYDTLPLFNVEFKGLIDYHTYYGSYLLIGMQLMVIAAVCQGKRMWLGIKRLFSVHPDFYSMITMMVLYTVSYDVIMILSYQDGIMPPVFHFVCVFWMLLAAGAELVLFRRERKLFLIFSSEASKYTAEQDGGAYSVAEKMYRGGIDEGQNIYSPTSVSFPGGFFRSVKADNHMSSKMIPWILLPAVLLSFLTGMISMLLNHSLTAVCVSVLMTLLVMLPCATVAVVFFPVGISGTRLAKRGIALTNQKNVSVYSQADYMVFNDLHLFKKCETGDTGMVIYEQSQAADLFGCLQLVYSKINGPMAKTFENVPPSCRFERLFLRRISRNGIEAIVEKKHVLIIGDAGYMQRYGLTFPMNEEWDGRATLCISLNGKVSAKISAAYEIEPIFEMLVERLAENGIRCVVETFDPMIHSAFVSEKRRFGVTPISVVHKNAEDLRHNGRRKSKAAETGILALSSRLKLAEAAVWCKRLVKVRRYSQWIVSAFSVLGMAAVGLLVGFGWISFVNQYWLLLLQLLPCLGIAMVTVFGLPSRDYFTMESLTAELVRAAERMEIKKQRKAKKGNVEPS